MKHFKMPAGITWLADFISEGISWLLCFQKCKPEQFLHLVFACMGKCLHAFGQNSFVLVFLAADTCTEGNELLGEMVTGEELWARTCCLIMTFCPVTMKNVFKTINDTLNISLNFQKQVYVWASPPSRYLFWEAGSMFLKVMGLLVIKIQKEKSLGS